MASSFLWHTQEVDSVAHELKTDLEQGLSSKEAASRLAVYGPNELPETDHIPWAGIFLRQQISLMIPILVLASVILILANMLNSALLVIGILVVNVILSGSQAIGSGRLLRKIRKLAKGSLYAKVLRSGNIKLSRTGDIVPGDIICFEKGDGIAADGRLIAADQLTIDETLVMRITRIAEKKVDTLDEDVSIHQRANIVFMGTTVVSGSGRAIVTSTGAQTQLAQMSAAAAEPRGTQWSLLEVNLSRRGIWLAVGCVVCSIILWVAMVIADAPPMAGVMMSLSFLVAAWPMGLIEAVIMALATGMKRMSQKQIIIRNFSGAEALAEATLLCSDKTGVITQKQMTVKKVFVDGRIMDVEGTGYDPESGGFPPDAEEENPDLPLLLTIAAMCSDTEVKNTPEGWNIIGDPTEGALIVAAMKGGINKDELGISLTKVAELPFDPERKLMTTVYESSENEFFIFTKGELEAILDISSNLQLHGYVDDLDIAKQRAIWAVSQSFAKDGMKSMAFAYCQLRNEPEEYTIRSLERNLVFVGMAGIIDPLRTDAKLAVQKCLMGGVQPIVFTDDYVDTAVAVAHDLGIVEDGSEVLAGEELDILGEREYSTVAERFGAYADVSPVHKIRIVRALKEKGGIIAVIGSHASDATVIGEADIGIVIGQTGLSIATDASDMVLLDNNFATAVDAIEVMRGAYANAKSVIRYLLSGSVAAAGAILIALIINIFQRYFPSISLPSLHMVFFYILWANLMAGGIPALGIAFSPVTNAAMKYGPYTRGAIFDDGLKIKIPIRGILTSFLVIIAFISSLDSEAAQERAVTAALTALVMAQIAFAFQCRRTPDEGFFCKYITSKLLLGLALLVILAQISIIYTPFLNQLFGTQPLLLKDWIPILMAFIVCSLPFDELFDVREEEESAEAEEGREEESDIKERDQDETVEEDTAAESDEDPE